MPPNGKSKETHPWGAKGPGNKTSSQTMTLTGGWHILGCIDITYIIIYNIYYKLYVCICVNRDFGVVFWLMSASPLVGQVHMLRITTPPKICTEVMVASWIFLIFSTRIAIRRMRTMAACRLLICFDVFPSQNFFWSLRNVLAASLPAQNLLARSVWLSYEFRLEILPWHVDDQNWTCFAENRHVFLFVRSRLALSWEAEGIPSMPWISKTSRLQTV